MIRASDSSKVQHVVRIGAAVVLGALCACHSTAPYTVPAAGVNAALAAGVAAGERAAGGCFAVCTHGTVCNTATGYCVPATARDACLTPDAGSPECIPLGIFKENEPVPRTVGAIPIGVSPATGTVPPPPAESSPKVVP